MKIFKQDQNQFIIKNGGFHIFAAIFLAIVSVIIFQANSSEIPWWVGLIILAMGVLTYILPTKDIITFDKYINKLSIHRKSVLKETSEEYDISKIKSVEIFYVPNSGNRGEMPQYKLACILEDGMEIILNPTSSSTSRAQIGPMVWIKIQEKEIGEKLASFLNVKFVERRPPTIGEALETISNSVQEAMEKFKQDK